MHARAIHVRREAWRQHRRTRAGGAACQAAGLFVAAGLIGLVYDAIPGTYQEDLAVSIALDCAILAIGVLVSLLPWQRWRPEVTLVLPALAFALIAGSHVAGVVPLPTYGIWFVLVYAWVGMWHPPRTGYLVAPLALLAYALPFTLGAPGAEDAVVSAIISIPAAVLVGESLARRNASLHAAELAKDEVLASLERANVTDDLTGLGNRRMANRMLDSLADGDGLAVFDLDHFKRINDSAGHAYGDRVLQLVGEYLTTTVRDGDAVARYGGEEFVVVLREVGSNAQAAVNRILAGWRALGPPTTMSAGVAVKQPGRSSLITFASADQALYRAKAEGRDRAVADPTEDLGQMAASTSR